MFFKWSFKTAAAVLIVTNTWNIVMGIFDAAQSVVNSAGGVIVSDASIDISSVVTDLETRLAEMELGPLFGLWFQSLFVGITMWALTICIFISINQRSSQKIIFIVKKPNTCSNQPVYSNYIAVQRCSISITQHKIFNGFSHFITFLRQLLLFNLKKIVGDKVRNTRCHADYNNYDQSHEAVHKPGT